MFKDAALKFEIWYQRIVWSLSHRFWQNWYTFQKTNIFNIMLLCRIGPNCSYHRDVYHYWPYTCHSEQNQLWFEIWLIWLWLSRAEIFEQALEFFSKKKIVENATMPYWSWCEVGSPPYIELCQKLKWKSLSNEI